MYIYIYHLVGAFNPSEKYESQLGWVFPIYIEKYITCSKPPTSHSIIYSTNDIPKHGSPRLATGIPQAQGQCRVQRGPRHGTHRMARRHDDEANGQAIELVGVLSHGRWRNVLGNFLGPMIPWSIDFQRIWYIQTMRNHTTDHDLGNLMIQY